MPRYAAKPYTLPNTTVHIFQRVTSRKGTFYWRFAKKGGGWHNDRCSHIAAAIEDPCYPPFEVIQLAIADYERAKKLEAAGLPVTSRKPTLHDAAIRTLADDDKVSGDAYRVGFINDYILGYAPFAKLAVADFSDNRVGEWLAWQAQRAQSGTLARSTLGKRKLYMREVLRNAVRLQWIEARDIPPFEPFSKSKTKPPRPTPRFNADTWASMEAAASDWIEDGTTEVERQKRKLLWLLCQITYAFGLRTAEVLKLRLRAQQFDPELGCFTLAVPCVKQRKHGGVAYPLNGWRERVADILANQLPRFYAEEYGIEHLPVDYLLMNADRSRAAGQAHRFDTLLRAAGVEHDAFGNKRSITSFRHTHISELIEDDEPFGQDMIASMSRTSGEMLDLTYNQASVRGALRRRQRRRAA